MMHACEYMVGKDVTSGGNVVGKATAIGLSTKPDCKRICMNVVIESGYGITAPVQVGSKVSIDGCYVGICVGINCDLTPYGWQTEMDVRMTDETIDCFMEYALIMSVMQ